ncbi:retrovirus-related pol polyprotein from transposon TNT 1-94 [Tanacetum coccineum]|uniref:Retrovirus-related pol polyprotein from transposon TNT 1-94 n=1 Tax=Tanacetum coccineum TaxID=301880 RepID=A0ABQ5C4B0_9ASTR
MDKGVADTVKNHKRQHDDDDDDDDEETLAGLNQGNVTLRKFQSPSVLKVPISVIPETTVLPPIPEIPTETPVSTSLSPPQVTPTILIVQQTTTPIPTPPIITEAPTITTVVPESDALTAVQLRVAKLEKDVSELNKINDSTKALAFLKSQVPIVVEHYLGSKIGDDLQKVLQRHTTDLIQKYSVKPTPESRKIQKPTVDLEQESEKSASEIHKDENDMDKGVADTIKSHKRQHAAAADDDDDDEDPSVGPNQGKNTKRRRTKESKSSKKPSTTKETSKGKAPSKSSKTGKSVTAKEPIEESTAEVEIDDAVNTAAEDVVHDANKPHDDSTQAKDKAPMQDWFKQPPRPPTPDSEWNKCQVVLDQPEQPWFNQMVSATKDPLTFNDLMATPIDFSKYVLNRLKIDNLTQDLLLGPAYNLLKGTCTSNIKLEYNFQECFNALTDKLDWNNPEGDRYPFDLSKPFPLQGRPSHLTVAADYFFNNDLEYLKTSDLEKTYTTSITKIKAARYEIVGIEDMTPTLWSMIKHAVKKLHGYGHLEDIVVKRADQQLYKFKEGDFVDLHLNDIEDMLLLAVQHKLFHLNESDIVDFIVALRMFTRSLIIKHRVKDLQLGVESNQKKLNITAPQKTFPEIKFKELYTPSYKPPGVIYEDLYKQKRVMRADELYKFSNGTLKTVRDELHHIILDFHIGYNKEMSRRKWTATEKREVPAPIASSSISSPENSNVHDEGDGQQDETRISSSFGGNIRDSRSTPHMAARVTNSGVGVDRLTTGGSTHEDFLFYCLDIPYGKRSRAPKEHSKGRTDIIGWDFVLYNRYLHQTVLPVDLTFQRTVFVIEISLSLTFHGSTTEQVLCNGIIDVKAAVKRKHINAAEAEIQHSQDSDVIAGVSILSGSNCPEMSISDVICKLLNIVFDWILLQGSETKLDTIGYYKIPNHVLCLYDEREHVQALAGRYDMVFVPFTGIDNHLKCVNFGSGMLLREDTEAYTWLLTSFMTAHEKQPTMVVTDQDGAMKRAIEAVLTESTHRLCMWHIMQKVPAKICPEIYDETDFKERFGKLVWNMFMEPLEFEGKWSKLVEDFGLQNHKWMTKMFDLRHMWLPAYFIHSPLFGLMRTTSRSESENAFFKNFTNHRSTLVNFMMCFESAMERQCYRQEVLDFRMFDSAPKLHTKLTIEIHACKVYTRTISLLVQKEIYEGCWACQIQEFKKEEGCEIVKVRDIRAGAYRTLYTEEGKETVIQEKDKVVDYKVVRNPEDGSVECTCRHFLRYGFLCRHVFCVLKNCNIEVILIYLDLLHYKNHRIVAAAEKEAGTAATATKQEARNTATEQLTTAS